MPRELTLFVGGEALKLFLQDGFFTEYRTCAPLHRHAHAELQLVLEGEVEVEAENTVYRLRRDEMLLIPAGLYHKRKLCTEGAAVMAFQLTLSPAGCGRFSLPQGTAEELAAEVRRYNASKRSNRLAQLLGLVCAELLPAADPMGEVGDRAYIIGEFFSRNYHREVELSHLAEVLSLSEKQCGRVLRAATGHTFREELTRYRMEAAQELLKQGSLSLAEIAERVGYRSYSGFWKALSKYEKQADR